MAVIKFAASGLFLSCRVKEFEDCDKIDTKLVLTDFSGRLTRIAQSSTRAKSSHLKIETDDELTTVIFCCKICKFAYGDDSNNSDECNSPGLYSNIRSDADDEDDEDDLSELKICGDQLCWISEDSESIEIVNLKALGEVE